MVILILTVALGSVGIFNVLPDGDPCPIAQFLEVFYILILSLLQLSRRAFVREDEKVFDHVNATKYVRRHLKII